MSVRRTRACPADALMLPIPTPVNVMTASAACCVKTTSTCAPRIRVPWVLAVMASVRIFAPVMWVMSESNATLQSMNAPRIHAPMAIAQTRRRYISVTVTMATREQIAKWTSTNVVLIRFVEAVCVLILLMATTVSATMVLPISVSVPVMNMPAISLSPFL